MAYIRRLPSGKWQATVRHPNGSRITQTDELKGRVKEWARALEAQFAHGDLRDPRAGDITVNEFFARWWPTRGIAQTTRDRDESRWRIHVEPKWGTWPMGKIGRLEAQGWVRALERTPWSDKRLRHHRPEMAGKTLGADTVHSCVSLMHQLFRAAMSEYPPIVVVNPFADLELPKIPPRRIRWYTREEAEAILAAVDTDRWRVLIEMGFWVGLRWEELAGLSGDRVDWLRKEAHVTHVMTPYGLREYPKSKRSHRVVPVPDWTIAGMAALMEGRPRDGLVFAGPRGGLSATRFHEDGWYPAVERAGVPRHSPHVMRHTAASWLVQDGVPLQEVQRLLGHETYSTTQQYAHLAPGAHKAVRDSWRRARDARPTHGGSSVAGA